MDRESRRRSAERIVSAISRRLVIARGAAIGTTIEDGLGEAAAHVGADGAMLMRTAIDDRIEYLHAWFDPSLGPMPLEEDHQSRSYDWVKQRLPRGGQVIDMREINARMGRPVGPADLREVAVIGTFAGELVAGVICFFYRTDNTTTTEELEPFEVLGDVFLGAITRRDAENELAVARRLEAIGQLAGGVAHDINNALTVILLHAERGERITTGPARESFEAILGAGLRASEVAHQLLAFARRQATQPRACDAGALVSSLQPMLERLVGEHIQIRTSMPDDRWSVLVDPIQLERVLINLAANARDAMPDGGALDITLSNRTIKAGDGKLAGGDYLAIEMRDSGAGMTQEIASRIFEPFFTTKSDRGGTGLGLASSYGVMQQLGGTIEVESIVGTGTRFTVLCLRSDTTAHASDRFPVVAPPRGLGEGRTILLVEDVDLLREALAQMLVEEGYRVLVAADGAAAHRLSQEHGAIDALVTDVVLPQMHGYRLAEMLREQRPALPVLYLSGYDRPQGLENALSQPNTAFASKPFASEQLLASLARLLG